MGLEKSKDVRRIGEFAGSICIPFKAIDLASDEALVLAEICSISSDESAATPCMQSPSQPSLELTTCERSAKCVASAVDENSAVISRVRVNCDRTLAGDEKFSTCRF